MSGASEPPWHETAVAVIRENDVDGVIVCEGTLAEVAREVVRLPIGIRNRVRVSLPDRGAPPFSYAGMELFSLLALLPTV